MILEELEVQSLENKIQKYKCHVSKMETPEYQK